MEILNYGIMQNQQIPLSDILGEIPMYDVDLYEEMGNIDFENGNEDQALIWYTKGLSIARQLRNEMKIEEFTNLILSCL